MLVPGAFPLISTNNSLAYAPGDEFVSGGEHMARYLSSGILIAFLLSGCGTTVGDTVTGSALGAGAGAAIGSTMGETKKGAAAGAGAGALGGYLGHKASE
jgi:hypothetical protein